MRGGVFPLFVYHGEVSMERGMVDYERTGRFTGQTKAEKYEYRGFCVPDPGRFDLKCLYFLSDCGFLYHQYIQMERYCSGENLCGRFQLGETGWRPGFLVCVSQ